MKVLYIYATQSYMYKPYAYSTYTQYTLTLIHYLPDINRNNQSSIIIAITISIFNILLFYLTPVLLAIYFSLCLLLGVRDFTS